LDGNPLLDADKFMGRKLKRAYKTQYAKVSFMKKKSLLCLVLMTVIAGGIWSVDFGKYPDNLKKAVW
jgi:hypothetical protein